MLRLLDILLTFTHLLVIGFNLLGWIWKRTRRLHLYLVVITAFSWLVLGLRYGMGYCFLTDWQWRIKERLGETNLPNSFITYYLQKITGKTFSNSLVDNTVAATFGIAALLSVILNFFDRKRAKANKENKIRERG
jgi:hypothetical protein